MIELALTKNDLLSALLAVSGAVDKKQSLLILSHILFVIDQGRLSLTATDLEIEMTAVLNYVNASASSARTTLSAKKLIDIIRSLENETLQIIIDEGTASVKSGRSQFKLTTLPAEQYPSADYPTPDVEFQMNRHTLLKLIQATHFAMAQQDVRLFLNSLLIELTGQTITAVAMDGHRMAVSRVEGEFHFEYQQQFLLPRRGVLEMLRVLNMIEDDSLTIAAGKGYFSVKTPTLSFVTKLTEARFPLYRKAIPSDHDKFVLIERDVLKRSLSRISILANEKTQGVLLQIQPGSLTIIAKNQDQEEAMEQLEATVDGAELRIGMNAGYLLDVLNYFPDDWVRLSMLSTEQSILVESLSDENYQYIIMPMKL